VFDNDADDDGNPLGVEELTNLPYIKDAKEESGKTIITIDTDEDFEFRLAASGSRGGFAVGGFTPAIAFPEESQDDDMTASEFEQLEKVDEFFVNADGSTTLLFDSRLHCQCTLANDGSRGGFAMGGFSPAIICSDANDAATNPEDLVFLDAVRSATLNDNNQLKIVLETDITYRVGASGSRGGFAVGGCCPAIVMNDPIDDNDTLQNAITFRNSPGLKSYDIDDDGSSVIVIDNAYKEELLSKFRNALTEFLDDINNQLSYMQYDMSYEQDLSRIELIVPEENLTRHDLHNDYYRSMYQTLEQYQYIIHRFDDNEITYEFVVKYDNKTFYHNQVLDSLIQ
jgi:hypothetical protein